MLNAMNRSDAVRIARTILALVVTVMVCALCARECNAQELKIVELEGRGHTATTVETTPAIFVTDWFVGGYPHDPGRLQQTLWQMTQGVTGDAPLVLLDIEREWYDAMYRSDDPQDQAEALSDAMLLIQRTREILHRLGYWDAKVLWYTNRFDEASIARSMPLFRAADVVCVSVYVRNWDDSTWRANVERFNKLVRLDTSGFPTPRVWPLWWHDDGQNRRQAIDVFRDRTEFIVRTFDPERIVMYSRRFPFNDIWLDRWDTDQVLDTYWRAVLEAHAAAQEPEDPVDALWFTPRPVEAPTPTRFATAHDWRSLAQAIDGRGEVAIDLQGMTIDGRGGKLSVRGDTIIRNGEIHRGEFHVRGRQVRFENVTFTGSMGNELGAAIRSRGDQNDVGDLAVVDCSFSDVRNAIDLAYGCDGVHIERVTGTRYAYLLWAEDSSDFTLRNITTIDNGVGPRLEHDIRLNRNVLRVVMEGLDLDPGGDWKNAIAWGGEGGCADLAILDSRVTKSITLGPRPHDVTGPRLDERVLLRNVTIDTRKMRADKYTAALVIAPTTDDVHIEGLTVFTSAGKPALDVIESAQGREAGLITVDGVTLNGELVH